MPVLVFVPPQVPFHAKEPPEGTDWIHEIKHDGFRTLIAISDGSARAYTRNSYNWTDRDSSLSRSKDTFVPAGQRVLALPVRAC